MQNNYAQIVTVGIPDRNNRDCYTLTQTRCRGVSVEKVGLQWNALSWRWFTDCIRLFCSFQSVIKVIPTTCLYTRTYKPILVALKSNGRWSKTSCVWGGGQFHHGGGAENQQVSKFTQNLPTCKISSTSSHNVLNYHSYPSLHFNGHFPGEPGLAVVY